MGKNSITDVDIAIIGAGPAGLYSAWRLLQDPKYQSKRICLFDAAGRPGGRILSVTIPEVPYVAELGAMRYLPEQILISSLIEKKLGLKTSIFRFPTLGYLLRGKFIPDRAFKSKNKTNGKDIRYFLKDDEKGMTPFELIVLAIQRALREVTIPAQSKKPDTKGFSLPDIRQKLKRLDTIDAKEILQQFTGEEWRTIKRYGELDGQPLYKIGFWNLVRRYLSTEGYNLAHDGSGYQSILNMWSSAEAIVWYLSDFAGETYKTIASGMGTLTDKLYSDILNATPKEHQKTVCNFGWLLTKITLENSGKEGKLRLDFLVNQVLNPSFGKSASHAIVNAQKVILALPQPALKFIEIEGFRAPPHHTNISAKSYFQTLLNSVTANPLFKLFLVYEKPWWKEEEVPSCFRVFTDLPLRQVYHFGKDRQYETSTDGKRDKYCLVLAYYAATMDLRSEESRGMVLAEEGAWRNGTW